MQVTRKIIQSPTQVGAQAFSVPVQKLNNLKFVKCILRPNDYKAVLRIRIHWLHMFLGLLDPDPDPLVRGMDPDSDPAVLRIRIHQIHMFLGLLDPDPDPLGRGMDPDPDPALDPNPDPSIIMQK